MREPKYKIGDIVEDDYGVRHLILGIPFAEEKIARGIPFGYDTWCFKGGACPYYDYILEHELDRVLHHIDGFDKIIELMKVRQT